MRRNPTEPEPEEWAAAAASMERAVREYDERARQATTTAARRYYEEKAGECRAAADQWIARATERQ